MEGIVHIVHWQMPALHICLYKNERGVRFFGVCEMRQTSYKILLSIFTYIVTNILIHRIRHLSKDMTKTSVANTCRIHPAAITSARVGNLFGVSASMYPSQSSRRVRLTAAVAAGLRFFFPFFLLIASDVLPMITQLSLINCTLLLNNFNYHTKVLRVEIFPDLSVHLTFG